MMINDHSFLEKFLWNKSSLNRAIFERPDSISALLPYYEYLPRDQVFVMRDGSLGAVLEVELIPHETLTEPQVLNVVHSLKPWFRFNEEFVVQLVYDCAPVSEFDKRLAELGRSSSSGHGVSDFLFQKKVEEIKASCKSIGGGSPLRRRLLLCIRNFPKSLVDQRKGSMSQNKGVLVHQVDLIRNNLSAFRDRLLDLKTSTSLNLCQLDAGQLLDYLRRFFNPVSYYQREFAPVSPHQKLADQIVFSSPKLSYVGISREGVKTRTLSLKTAPSYSFPGGMAQFVGLKFPFRIGINISFPTSASVKKFLSIKEFFLENAATARAQVQKEEVQEIQRDLARDDRCLQMTFTISLEGDSIEELDERTRKICQVFHHELESEVVIESDIGLGLALNTLPLNYSPEADLSTRRAIRILRSDIMNFIPIFDSFRGLEKPTSLYLSRENALVPFPSLRTKLRIIRWC